MKVAAGAIFVAADTHRVLLNLRAPNKTHRLQWAGWGGMSEADESPSQTLHREISEEMGSDYELIRIYPFDIYQSPDQQFRFYSFVYVVAHEFVPRINHESAGWCWVDRGCWPSPMHPGTRRTFASHRGNRMLDLILEQHIKAG